VETGFRTNPMRQQKDLEQRTRIFERPLL
jgi:hypothetical protein